MWDPWTFLLYLKSLVSSCLFLLYPLLMDLNCLSRVSLNVCARTVSSKICPIESWITYHPCDFLCTVLSPVILVTFTCIKGEWWWVERKVGETGREVGLELREPMVRGFNKYMEELGKERKRVRKMEENWKMFFHLPSSSSKAFRHQDGVDYFLLLIIEEIYIVRIH